MKAWLRRIDAFLFGLIDKVVIVLVAIITVAVIATVFARYVLNNSFSWGEELPGLLLVSLTFLGSAWLARYDQHLAFDGLLMVLPPPLRKGVQVFNLLMVEFFLVCLTYYGWVVVRATGSNTLVTIDFPLVVFRAMVPIGGALMFLGYGVQILQLLFPESEVSPSMHAGVAAVDEAERILAEISAASPDPELETTLVREEEP